MINTLGSSLDAVILRIEILITHHLRMLIVLTDTFKFIMSDIWYLILSDRYLVSIFVMSEGHV